MKDRKFIFQLTLEVNAPDMIKGAQVINHDLGRLHPNGYIVKHAIDAAWLVQE